MRRLLALLLLCVWSFAQAQPVPSVQPFKRTYELNASNQVVWQSGLFPDKESLCASLPNTGTYFWGPGGTYTACSISDGSCWHRLAEGTNECKYQRFISGPNCDDPNNPFCNSAGTRSWPVTTVNELACPGGANLAGTAPNQVCECPAGQNWDDSRQICTGCTLGAVGSSGFYRMGPDPTQGLPVLACQSLGSGESCEVVFDGLMPDKSVLENGVRVYYASGPYRQTGNRCSVNGVQTPMPDGSTEAPQDDCGAGKVSGTINNRTVCVDQETGEVSEPSQKKGTTETTSTTETLPDGSVKDTVTSIKCDGDGNCTKTTTTTVTSPNGSKSVSETRTPISGTGAPTTGDDGSSDEAKDEEPTPECEEGDTSLRCLQLGGGVDDVPIANVEVGVGITPSSGFEHAQTCPADKVLNLAHVTVTVPFTLLCDAADMARPLVIGVAWLSALLGFVGIGRRD